MAKIFITGSADGLGQLAARSLIRQGHDVVLHARNKARGQEAMKKNPGAAAVVTADLSNIEETRALAGELNRMTHFDAVIQNAGIYQASAKDLLTVNVLAPHILTCLMRQPQRLIYISSGMHLQGRLRPGNVKGDLARISYSDSKLCLLMLAMATGRRWPGVYSNGVNPGWVPTKMGGRGAPDDLQKGYETQVWLATSDDEQAKVTGRYFFHQKEQNYNPDAGNIELQDELLDACREMTGVSFPEKTG